MKTVVILCGVVILASLCFAEMRQIHVNELHGNNVIGVLGKPLGSRTIIIGTLADDVMVANPLRITEVDTTNLNEVVKIEIKGVQLHQGTHYKIEGYESGGWSRTLPNWLAPGVQQPFQFRSFFVATKVLEPVNESVQSGKIP